MKLSYFVRLYLVSCPIDYPFSDKQRTSRRDQNLTVLPLKFYISTLLNMVF